MITISRIASRTTWIFVIGMCTAALGPACAERVEDDGAGESDDDVFRSTSWARSARGHWFREATPAEQTANEWPAGTYLVIYPQVNVRTNKELPVVTSATQVQYVPLSASASITGVRFDELSFDTSTVATSSTPTFYRLSSASSSVSGHVTMDDEGGLIGFMTFPTLSVRSREVVAGEANMALDAIAVPGGGVPSPSQLLVTFTPTDTALPTATNDIAVADPITFTPLALFGSMYWCQQHPTNWKSLIAESGYEIRQGFRSEEPGAGTTDTGWNIVFKASWCMFWDANDNSQAAIDEAQQCDWGKDAFAQCVPQTCTDVNGHDYPFTGCYGLAGCYRDHVWDAVEYADRYLALPNLMLAQVETWGVLQDPGDRDTASPICPAGTISENADRLCGIAYPPSAGDLAGASVVTGRPISAWPASNIPGIDVCGSPFVWTHEVGHNHGAYHEFDFDNAPHNSGCDSYRAVMQIADAPANEVTCSENWFSPTMTDFMLTTCAAGVCPRAAAYVDHL